MVILYDFIFFFEIWSLGAGNPIENTKTGLETFQISYATSFYGLWHMIIFIILILIIPTDIWLIAFLS